MDLRILALIAGTSFGTWPFLSGPSGYGGTTAAAWMALSTIVVAAPLSYMGWFAPAVDEKASMTMLMVGGLIQTLGIVAMAMLAAQAQDATERSQAMALAFVVNAAVPVVVFFATQGYTSFTKTGGLSAITLQINRYDVIGMTAVVVAAYCLTRPRIPIPV